MSGNGAGSLEDHPISICDDEGPPKKQATILIEIGEHAHLFHDSHQTAYALVGGTDCLQIESVDFKEHLQHQHYDLTGAAANRNSLSEAVLTLAAKAKYDGPEEPVFIRKAYYQSRLYIDLCNVSRQVIEVAPYGWQLLDESPVNFLRPRTSLPLSTPVKGGELHSLLKFANVAEDDFPLLYGFLLGCFATSGPYFHLALIGEQGTSKSTLTRVIRRIVDPSSVPLAQPPRDEEQLLVNAQNNWVVALDNLSGIQPNISDCLCRLSTGGGFIKRKLFTDGDQYSIDVQRPAILNGIDDIATRPDLTERTITLNLKPIQHMKREADLWSEFDTKAPEILGAVCDALVYGLAYEEVTSISRAPRMLDASTWIQACEVHPALSEGDFVDSLLANLRETSIITLESHPLTQTLMLMLEEQPNIDGTPTEVLDQLSAYADEEVRKSKPWPKSSNFMSQTLRRYGKPLREVGINIESDRSSSSRRITIRKRANVDEPRHARHGVINSDLYDANDGDDDHLANPHSCEGPIEEREDWV